MIVNTVALEEYLLPLQSYLDDQSISEILINRPHSVFIERKGNFFEFSHAELSLSHLMGLANLIARSAQQRVSDKEPLLSAQLPSGHRIQIILSPATAQDRIIISIRKQTINNIDLNAYEALGVFNQTKPAYLKTNRSPSPESEALLTLFNKRDWIAFLKQAIKEKKNILISGATSTGKTTFLNACLKEIPEHEHIVTLEDVAELTPPHRLHTPLFAAKGLQGMAMVTMQDLVQASLRIRPDRIIMGELRGAEASDFINATATGHDGSISSLHAASPYAAFMRLVHMVKLGGTNLSREDILDDLHTVVDIVVQLKRRVENHIMVREVSDIYFADAIQ